MRCQGSPLQIGKYAGNGVAPAGLDGLTQRTLGADEDRACDQELGHIHVERPIAGAPSVAADRSTNIGPSSTMTTLLALSLPCEMPAPCRRATCCHSSSRLSVLTCSALESSRARCLVGV